MAFENQVHVDQHFIRARLRDDGTTVEATLFLLPELADTEGATVQAGWAVGVAGSPVEISAGEIDEDGKAVLLTIPETLPGVDVVVSYTAGSGFITGNGLPLISFSNRPVANFSEVVPPAENAYPLDDDGTAAAALGLGYAPTNAPHYLRADYAYVGGVANGDAVALPTMAALFGAQAVVVGAGTILACEAVIHAAPAAFDGVGLLCFESDGAAVSGEFGGAIGNATGSAPTYFGAGVASTARAAAAAGCRIGLSINGDTGEVILHTPDGPFVSGLTFTQGRAATFGLFVTDTQDGPPNVGNTCSIELVPAAADMQLTYPVGAVDVFGDPV